jgi:hypothetical protein
MALVRTSHPADVIHHADKGRRTRRWTSGRSGQRGRAHCRSGRPANAYDNAAVETFWGRLIVEIAWIRGSIWFDTRAATLAYLFEFIRSCTTGNATKLASITSPQPNTLTSGATTTDNQIRHEPVSKIPGQVQYR